MVSEQVPSLLGLPVHGPIGTECEGGCQNGLESQYVNASQKEQDLMIYLLNSFKDNTPQMNLLKSSARGDE